MSPSWKWPGSRWWRLDLHTHTTASDDFRAASDGSIPPSEQWAVAAKEAGLDAVAVTDHNTPEGISGIQAAAEGNELTVFPGVELTVQGIHLLCIFDPRKGGNHVLGVLGQLGILEDQLGCQDATASKSICEAIAIIRAAGGIVIAAHVNCDKGLVKTVLGEERLKALSAPDLIAAEISPATPDSENCLEPSSPEVQNWLNNTFPVVGRVIPQIWCSDGHRVAELGRRFTWVKMTSCNIEGLELALLDGEESLRPASRENPGDPNQHASSLIESITVRQAKYMGRARGEGPGSSLEVGFNPWLNTIIGSRGTGKSTLVDLCRLTLRREDELNNPNDSTLRAAFDSRMRNPKSRTDEGLLTDNTQVELVYRKDGERFALSYSMSGTAPAIARLEGDQRIPEAGDIRERFPVRIYSQKQLFALAQNPNALLVVIDDSAQVHGTELERQRKESETKYLSLCAEARALRARAADLPMRAATLADLRRKMEVLQKGGHAATLNAYRAINRYDTLWRAIQKSAQEGIARVDAASGDPLVLADLNLGLQAENDSSTDPLKRAHAQLIRVAESLQRHVQEAVAQARREMSAVQEGADAVAWRTTVEQSVKRYESVTRNLAEAGIANPDEYGDLVKRTAILEQEISSLQHLGQESEKRAQEASAELQRYRELRSELTKRRQAFVLKTSSELIRVTISAHKDREGLEDYVRQSLGILSFDRDIAALSEKSAPDSGADWTFDLLDAQVKKLRDLLIDGSMAWEGVDRRFDAQLRKVTPERIDRLALYLPEDQVTVEFRRNSTSPSYQPLHQGSPGQQTAALLAFVLGYGDEPIILDQPEDDLDNTLIYEVLVQRLREQKKRRQVIIVTHNANIVVHGDAELVISLEAGGGQTHIKCEGGLQEKATREEICRVMEGGPEAFKSRYRRIALGGRSDG